MTTPSTLHPRERGSVRANDPITSQWAADTIAGTLPSQAEVVSAIRRSGRVTFTLADVERFTRDILSPSRARTAVRELQDKGLVEETGKYAITASGRRARLLTLTEQGRAAA